MSILKKGEYKVIDLMCISKPLYNQTYQEPQLYDVYKSVLERNDKKYVVYFLDDIDLGQNSIIYIYKDLRTIMLYKNLYKVIYKTQYKLNNNLIETLLNKIK